MSISKSCRVTAGVRIPIERHLGPLFALNAVLRFQARANGLREPLVIAEVDGVWMLIDGRNQRAACKIAGVEPTTRELEGEDPTAFVLSANIHRRHITKGQRGMAVALIYPKPEKGGRGQKATVSVENISPQRLSHARAVLA